MEDGSPPPKSVSLQRFCYSMGTRVVANTMKTGQFIYTADVDAMKVGNCVLQAVLKGYDSTAVNISRLNWWSNPYLPEITLREHDASLGKVNTLFDTNIYFSSSSIPPDARQPWANALKAMQKENWALAERQLRIVVKEAPDMAEAWSYLGEVTQYLGQTEDALQAFEKAVKLDRKLTKARIGLLRSQMSLNRWADGQATADALIRDKADNEYPEIHAHLAIARYNLDDLEGAASSAQEAILRDTKHQLPRSEMVLATILAARGDYDGAREHMQRYLDLDPRAADAAAIREQMSHLGEKGASGEAPAAPVLAAFNPTIEAAGEAWVPGGMTALAKMAGMPGEPAYQTFFEEYCRSIGREVSVGTALGIPRYTESLRAFLAAVTELIPLGEKNGENSVIRMSVAEGEPRQHAERVLSLLGWTLEERDGGVHVEPGYRPHDAQLQTAATALGIDQIAMQEALQAGDEFTFEIVSENARLVGGDAWTQILIDDLVPPGGLAAVFATDIRIAKTCAGLNAMNADTAAAIMTAMGLRNLAEKQSALLFNYGEAFSITDGRADVPGGPAADPAWQKLVGVDPRNPAKFFSALVEKENGRVAAFYATLARADKAHQRYFTQSTERAQRFYQWFRDSPELAHGVLLHRPGFHTEFLQTAPLDDAGNLRLPGGQSAWFPGKELPLEEGLLKALLSVARLEEKLGVPLDREIAEQLASNHARWAALFPYFESLPALDREDYAALATFSDALERRPEDEQNAVLGEWNALVDLIVRGAKAGSLNDAVAARAFRQASLDLSGDAHATQAVALLRQLAGSGDLEDAVAENLLQLDEEQCARFDRALELLHAPGLAGAQPGDVPAALSALVYAAALDPGLLVLNEDPGLLRRHRHATSDGPLFAPAALHGSDDANGTHFSGGFAGFEDAAKPLMGGAKAPPRTPVTARVAPQASTSGTGDAPTADFRSDSKLVEVYTTVTDNRGRYIDDLDLDQFTLVDGKDPRTIIAFEPQTSDLSVALLLDTTGSMADTIASLKRAAIKMIDALRPGDSVAVYSFSDKVIELAPYTTDHGVTKRAVMDARPFGDTALYDAITRAGHELTGRSGKKVVIVFTDGRDTASMLTVDAAIERAKVAGVPVYTIAEGEATNNPELLGQLAAISNATGGVPFEVRNPDDMGKVFDKVTEDLTHGYLLYFQVPSADAGEDNAWRQIRVEIGEQKGLNIRAREGYYP